MDPTMNLDDSEVGLAKGMPDKNMLNDTMFLSGDDNRQAAISNIQWVISTFENMSVQQLYSALRLRESIFIVEQDVPYEDMDGKDLQCMHLMGYLQTEMVAYMRMVPLDLFEQGCYSLGRVVVRADMRGTGVGRELVCEGLRYLDEIRNGRPIKISSQLYLMDFYASLGFTPQGEPYIEDRIPHISMIKKT